MIKEIQFLKPLANEKDNVKVVEVVLKTNNASTSLDFVKNQQNPSKNYYNKAKVAELEGDEKKLKKQSIQVMQRTAQMLRNPQ